MLSMICIKLGNLAPLECAYVLMPDTQSPFTIMTPGINGRSLKTYHRHIIHLVCPNNDRERNHGTG